MRFDKLTTKFQQALAEGQSLAAGKDNPYIEPQHVLLALLDQDDGGTASLLSRASVNVPALRAALAQSIERLPRVEGTGGRSTSPASSRISSTSQTRKRRSAAINSFPPSCS
jgi:ATP-dependent Clp protease ATP-binding subunit ClpB